MKIVRLNMFILFFTIVVGSMMGNEITKLHNLPQNGDNFTKTRMSFVAPGDSGKNVVWDFSQAQVIDGNSKVFYSVIDDSLINATEYGTRYDFRLRGDTLLWRGYENRSTFMRDSNAAIELIYPMRYGDNASKPYCFYGEYSRSMTARINGISRVRYNSLNLPESYLLGNERVRIVYDATGRKLSEIYELRPQSIASSISEMETEETAESQTNDSLWVQISRRDYCGNYIYQNGNISMIITPAGYISGSMRYYYLKDYQGNNSVVLNQNGVVQQINHYYPYGSLMGEVMNTSSQPYRYGDKELVTLGGLNLSDFGARWLDSPSGTFTTMDPLCEDFQHLSPYLYCAGNPIKYIDPTGMTFTDVAQQYANRLKKEAILRLVGAITAQKVDWNVISEASSTIKEIIILEKSSQVYDVVEDRSLGANYGETRANYSNKRIEIALGDMGVSMDLIAHEFKHLYQFEIGDYSIGPTLSSEPHNLFYDQYDEVEAYSRGAIFGGPEFPTIQSLPAKYSNYHNKKMNATRYPNIKTIIRGPIIKKNNSLQNISKSIKHVFRIHGKTYWPN